MACTQRSKAGRGIIGMTYCISDIHGEYELFARLLEKINYSNSDCLIVCGDFIDKGTASVRLAKTIFDLPNARCIMGNHEYLFLKFYQSQMQTDTTDFDAVLAKLQAYFEEDGHLLDWSVVDAIADLPYYIEEEQFVCVHAGVPMDADGRLIPLEKATPEELVYDRRFQGVTVLPKESKCVFFGHTPTTYIAKEPKILAYPKRGIAFDKQNIAHYAKIHLDTGTPLSGVLGCFCVDTCKAFYVKK